MVFSTAERAGFEPAKPFRGLHAFQACLFNHSSISPIIRLASSKTTAKYEKIPICNLFSAQIYSFCLTYTQNIHEINFDFIRKKVSIWVYLRF